ncbi:murein biosynthesis integral membrane protein MurJ [Candidatus Daviesbacteria bacterium]|nr:murein biosynthesis integral membrane protein MurJ [Candidatus Daviesbacteria bacterium]
MVKSLLNLLALRQSSILSGATVLMVAVFASRFLGLIRDRLLVQNFDTSEAAVFFAAFRLPDLLFQILIFGSLSVAFIPVFTEILHKKGEIEAFKFASSILNLSLLVFGLVVILSAIFVGPLNSLIVPGFSGEQKILTDRITQIILIAQMFLVVGTFFFGIAHTYQRFIIPALAPIFYNLGIIIGIIFLTPIFGITGLGLGVVLGAALHVLVQVPFIKSLGFKYQLTFDFLNSGVKEVFRLMSIRNFGLIAEQINEAVGVALASLLTYSSVTLLTFATHLFAVPIGLFGATIAQAALPVLSKEYSKDDLVAFKSTLLTTMHQILFLTLPAAAILIVLRIPVVRLVFGADLFSWEDTVLTGKTVAFFAIGLSAQSVVLLLVRGFYAMKDTKTPVIVSLISISLNITLSFLFVLGIGLGVWAIGLAFSISIIIGTILLAYFLSRKLNGFKNSELIIPATKMLIAAVAAAFALYIPMKALDQLIFDTTRTVNLIMLTGIASGFGLSIYVLLVWLLDVRELTTFIELIKKIGRTKIDLKSEELPKDTGSFS